MKPVALACFLVVLPALAGSPLAVAAEAARPPATAGEPGVGGREPPARDAAPAAAPSLDPPDAGAVPSGAPSAEEAGGDAGARRTASSPTAAEATATGEDAGEASDSAAADLPGAVLPDPRRPEREEPGPSERELPGPVLEPPAASTRCGTLESVRCSLFWLPLASVVVPGLGQALDRRPAVPYFVAGGLGLGAGLAFTELYLRDHPQEQQSISFTPTNDMLLDGNGQAALVFSLLEQDAGFISAYDTYRHRLVDELGVPTSHTKVPDLLAAPLHLEKLLKPAVVLPLAVVAALTVVSIRQDVGDSRRSGTPITAFDGYRAGDAVTTVALSYGAGTSEEAFFRGFFMSYLEHRWSWNPLLANGVQGVVFSLAHGVSDGAAALGLRAALGWYLGWLAQRSDYDLTDGAFVHAWWDVIAFSAVYAIERPKLAANGGRVMMTFPAVAF